MPTNLCQHQGVRKLWNWMLRYMSRGYVSNVVLGAGFCVYGLWPQTLHESIPSFIHCFFCGDGHLDYLKWFSITGNIDSSSHVPMILEEIMPNQLTDNAQSWIIASSVNSPKKTRIFYTVFFPQQLGGSCCRMLARCLASTNVQEGSPVRSSAARGWNSGRFGWSAGELFWKNFEELLYSEPLRWWRKLGVLFLGGFHTWMIVFLDVGVDLVGLEAFLGQRIGEVLISHGGSCSLFLWVIRGSLMEKSKPSLFATF